MTIKDGGCIIQAFPVGPHTYVGTPNAFDPSGYQLIHAVADGDITFDFGTAGSVTMTVTTGQDIAIHESCVAITATGICWIS